MESETKDTKSQLQFKKKKRKNEKERVTELEPETVQVKVQVVREKPNKISPLVGYFPSGFDPLKHSGSSSFQVYRNTKMTKRLQLVVKPDDCPAEYVGTNYSGEAAVPTGATKHVLGILDKDTQTLRLVPIAGNKIFRLEPKIKEEEALGRETSTLKELTPQEKAIKAQQTTDMWGTKKAIKKTIFVGQDIIVKDLGKSSLDVKSLYEHLGCKISRMENKDGKRYFGATLPVPLQFPGLRLRKTRRLMN